MKIIKEVGERLLPSWLAAELRPILVFTGTGAALWAGSVVLAVRAWQWLTDRLNFWEAVGALLTGAYLAGYGCLHAPHLARFAIPGAVLAWCVAAWCVAPQGAAEEAAPDPAGPAELDARAAFVRWLLDLIGDQSGIHLRELYPAMRQLPGCERHDDTRLRGALRAFQIPVHRSLRIGRDAGRSGVRKSDLPPLSPIHGERPVETGGDAGQSVDSPQVSVVGEGVESG